MNVVHLDIDIYDIRGKETQGCCTPEERGNFNTTLSDLDLIDSFRHTNPEIREWSYYSRRNRGAR